MNLPSAITRRTVAMLIMLSGSSLFQSTSFAQLAIVPSPQGFEPHTGAKVGGFTVGVRAEAGVAPTSNVRLDPSEESDVMRILSLSGSAQSDWENNHLAASLDFFAQDAADSTYEDLDHETLSGSLSSRFDIGGDAILRAAVQRNESIIGKNHVDQINGLLHGTTVGSMASSGIEWDNAKWFVSAMGQYVDVVNDTETQGVDEVLKESLDRGETQLTLQSGRHFAWGNVYAFVGSQAINYDASESLQLSDRDSEGWRVGAGVEFSHGKFRGAASAIRFKQDFDTNRISNLSATVGTVQLAYQISPQFTLSGLLQRNFDETNIEGSAGIFTDTYFVGFMYSPHEKIYFKLGPAYNRSELAGTSMATKRVSWEWASQWQVSPRVALSFNGSYSDQRVTDPSMLSQQYADTSARFSVVFTY